jgi:hypothetical protein
LAPVRVFAVNGAEAWPLAFVVCVMVVVLLLNLPLAPVLGAVNVTVAPCTGSLAASSTVTDRALANAVLTVAVCGVVPVFAVIELAPPRTSKLEVFTDKTTAGSMPDVSVRFAVSLSLIDAVSIFKLE